MKRWIHAAKKQTSQCSFDFDLGNNYSQDYIEDKLYDIFSEMDLEIIAVDFRPVEYPRNKVYSQCGIDFKWKDYYNEAEIEEDIANMIDDEGGNFFGIEFNSLDNVTSSTEVECDTDIQPNGKIQKGLRWNNDGHEFEVISVSGNKCKVTEGWISEDTGKFIKRTYDYLIDSDSDGVEYAYDPKYEEYANPGHDNEEDYSWWARKYASGADNYPFKYSDEYDEELSSPFDNDEYEEYDDDDYTPSATAGDYGPSNPWDAPGMSVRDFI